MLANEGPNKVWVDTVTAVVVQSFDRIRTGLVFPYLPVYLRNLAVKIGFQSIDGLCGKEILERIN